MTDTTAAEALLAEALADTAVGVYPTAHDHARALLAHPALADALLRGLGAGVDSWRRWEAETAAWLRSDPAGDTPTVSDLAEALTRIVRVSDEHHACSDDGPCTVLTYLRPEVERARAILQPPARPGPTDGPSQRGEGS